MTSLNVKSPDLREQTEADVQKTPTTESDMNESTISQPNHSRHPEKCADTADLQKTIENMHNLAEISFGQIGSLITITLCAMKAGTCHASDIGRALEAIAYLAEDADGVIYGEAMAAGCASQAPVNAYPASNPLSVIKV